MFIPNSPATVRYPNDGSASIMALIGSASSGFTFGAALRGV
ncbi:MULTISPECIES: hypothetical protein [Xanthomonas]|nr:MULTISPECIES: hypothetical protein [Xanthomonas]